MRAEIDTTEMQTVPLNLTVAIAAVKNRPDFAELNYSEMVHGLANFYFQMRAFLKTPAIVQYEDLAHLRRRAYTPVIGTWDYSRIQAQLNLAADLLRLGRRHEGFLLLNELERGLREAENYPLSYQVWIALLRAAAGDRQGAFLLALNVAGHGTNPALDTGLLHFFKKINGTAAA